MMNNDPLQHQVGGNHYESFVVQPLEFITKNRLSFIDGSIIKYILRHRFKKGKEDLEKAIHFCELAISFGLYMPVDWYVGVSSFIAKNKLEGGQAEALMVLFKSCDKTCYIRTADICKNIIKLEYGS